MVVFIERNVSMLYFSSSVSNFYRLSLSLQSEPEVVPQTDLVPTLALLLGAPIPYSNVGQVLLPLFPEAQGAAAGLSQLEALWVNVKQVGGHDRGTGLKAFKSNLTTF